MSPVLCFGVALATIALGTVAIFVGARNGSMAAKVGGSFIAVFGVLGLIACSLGP